MQSALQEYSCAFFEGSWALTRQNIVCLHMLMCLIWLCKGPFLHSFNCWHLLLQTAMDQLHMHFTSAIHNTAFTIVLGYVELASGTGDGTFHKRQYLDLCKVSTYVFCI